MGVGAKMIGVGESGSEGWGEPGALSLSMLMLLGLGL